MNDQAAHCESILITGGLGCIGVMATRWLLENTNSRIVIGSRKANQEAVQQSFPKHTDRVQAASIDVLSTEALHNLLDEQQITRVAHMAGLQTPDCNEHRDLGLQTNLAGTQNLVEGIKAARTKVQRFVFASSVAVYGPRVAYPAGRVPMSSEPKPVNVYGVWKLAGEHISRLFHEETGVDTISVRPGALFGPGRDRGLTSTPTTAMKHVAKGERYEIPYRSKQDYLYSPDVGAAVGSTLVEPFDGYAAFTLPSHTADTSTLVELMREVASELGVAASFDITIGQDEVPFICDLEYQPFLDAFPKVRQTELREAIRQSIVTFGVD